MAINSIGGVSDNILEGPFGSDKSIQYNNNGIWAGSTNLVWDSNNTRLGVGINTPLEALDVNGVIQANSSIKTVVGSGVQAELILEQNTVATWEIYNPASSTDLLLKNTTDLFAFTSSGRLGIGLTNPSRPLHVQGSINAGNLAVDIENTDPQGVGSLNLIAGNAAGLIGMNGDASFSLVGGSGNIIVGNYYSAGGSETGGIAFVSGGNVERMRLDKEGNLGIGLISPSQLLHLSGAPSTGGIRIDEESNAIYQAYLTFLDTSGNFGMDVNGGGKLRFATGGVERVTILSTGEVGIGTIIPARPLHISYSNENTFAVPSTMIVQGTDDFNTGTAGSGISFIGEYDSSSNSTTLSVIGAIKENIVDGDYGGALVFHTRQNGNLGDERMRITSTGRVGIGTDSPNYPLTVFGETFVGVMPGFEQSGKFYLGRADGTGTDIRYHYIEANNSTAVSSNHLSFNIHTGATTTSTTEVLRLQGNGRVGIGTESPTRLLHLSSTVGTFARFTSENTDDFSVGANANGFVVYNETDADYPFIITNTGNVGISTTSPTGNANQNSLVLEVNGSGANPPEILAGGQNAEISIAGGSGASYLWSTGAYPLVMGTNSTERLRILATGGITFNGDSAEANALDDYEEGTWTPTFYDDTALGLSYSEQQGSYTKIGRLVYAKFRITVSAKTGGSSGQGFFIAGLPFLIAYFNTTVGTLSGTINTASNITDVSVPENLSFISFSSNTALARLESSAGVLTATDIQANTVLEAALIYHAQ